MDVEIVKGSVVFAEVDAVVNAANKYLQFGGGLCGAMFLEAGVEELNKECSLIGHCDVGDAVITSGCKLKAKYIIHAVGPNYPIEKEPESKLKSAYLKSLLLAEENGVKSIAFPSLSTGIHGFPIEEASKIALKTIMDFKAKNLKKCYLYCYHEDEFRVYEQTLKEIKKIGT